MTAFARPALRVAALLCGLTTLDTAQAQVVSQWYAVYLDEARVGQMEHRREVRGDTVETRTEIRLRLSRSGESMAIESSQTSIEDRAGRPIGFASRLDGAGLHSNVLASVDREGRIEAVVDRAGRREVQRMTWPKGAVLAEGERLAILAAGNRPGSHIRIERFDPSSLRSLRIDHETLESVAVELPEGSERLLHMRQTLDAGSGRLDSDYWRRPENAEIRRMRIPALGLRLDVRACSRACAEREPVGSDVLIRTLTAAPRPLGLRERLTPLRFRIEASGPLDTLTGVPGQFVHTADDGVRELLIDPDGGPRLPPRAADTRPTRWLQSNDAGVRELARNATGRSTRPARQMARLEQAVREHIAHKSLRIGYASAAEVIQLAEGDCTEHAVLLAATARSLGIPARVVTGLAYAPRYAGRLDVFVPHAWVIAWVDGRWRGYDASLPRFDASHIGLAAGDGDPFDFYTGMDLLGRLRISAIERVGRRELAAIRADFNQEFRCDHCSACSC